MIEVLLLLCVLVPGIYFWEWADARLGGRLQARVGPDRAGRAGILQPLAGLLSAFQKHREGGDGAGPVRHQWWIQGATIFGLVSLIPAGTAGPPLAAPMAVLMAPLLGLAYSWSATLISWRDGNLESRLSSVRQLSTGISAFFPAFMALLQGGFAAGGFSWSRLQEAQGWAPWSWLVARSPLCLLSLLIFTASGLLLFSVPPLSFGRDPVRWIAAGIRGRSGIRLLWVKWSRSVAMFCWAAIAATVFLGGAAIPRLALELVPAPFADALAVLVLGTKALLLLLGVSLIARTLPSARADQAHDLAWRVLCPLALLSLVAGQIFWVGG